MPSRIRQFAEADTAAVIVLWGARGLTRPWNDPVADIERKLRVQPELFLVAEDAGEIVGSVMAGYDGHRGWLYYLASAAERAGEGIGRALVAEAEARLAAMGCPKVQLMVRSENTGVVSYYDALGYEGSDVVVRGKRLDTQLDGHVAS